MNRLWAQLKALRTDTRGNVAIIFAGVMTPLLLFVGASVDYSRAAALRTALQAALDATALMASKNAATQSGTDLTNTAQKFFDAVFVEPNAQTNPIEVTYNFNNGAPTVTVKGSSSISTDFIRVVGLDNLTVGSSSTVTWGKTKLQVALVLDNSGSMGSAGKITALKTATHQLLTTLKGAATNDGDVQVSIVPFSKDVNVGKGNANQPWLKWSGQSDTWDENNGSCSKSGYNDKSSCETPRCNISGYSNKNTCNAAAVCSKSQYTSKNTCQNHSGTWTVGNWSAGSWTHKDHSAWNGCVMDRDKDPQLNYDVQNTTPNPNTPASLFVPEQYGYCPPGVVKTLGYDWTALNQAVDDMQPNGSTNQTIGLALGWQTLTMDAPFLAPALQADTKQVIILLSDGLNTQNRWDGNGSDTSSAVNDRMALACSNVKNAKIEIYTIQVNTSGDPLSTVLQSCASGTDHFSAVTTSNQIITTFQDIGAKLAQLRISR